MPQPSLNLCASGRQPARSEQLSQPLGAIAARLTDQGITSRLSRLGGTPVLTVEEPAAGPNPDTVSIDPGTNGCVGLSIDCTCLWTPAPGTTPEVTADTKVRAQIKKLQDDGYGHYPVCVAKTQYSFSTDAQKRGAPENHVINVREVRLAAGAEFVVTICGDIMTMPGLPKVPSANKIDLVDGKVVGLF